MAYVNVPIKLLSNDVEIPSYAYEGDAGLDLGCAEATVTIQPHAHALVGTGVAVAIPEGYAGFVLPRSGLAAKQGVTVLNTPGLIDSKYRGEIKVILANTSDKQVSFFKGDRIAQLVIQEVAKADLVRVVELDHTVRGSGGFGSSGVGAPKRTWHVEHADGSEWTMDDLEEWALHADEGLIYCDMDGFYLDEYGALVILDECGHYCHAPDSADMRVVWD